MQANWFWCCCLAPRVIYASSNKQTLLYQGNIYTWEAEETKHNNRNHDNNNNAFYLTGTFLSTNDSPQLAHVSQHRED